MTESLVQPGDLAPEFCLPRDSFTRVCLRDLLKRDRHVVLVFYVLDFTGA